MPLDDINAEMKKIIGIFEKEVEMYQKIVPKLKEIFEENGIKTAFAPKCWKVVHDPEMLIMEDLGVRNFANENRLTGMDMQHAKMVISKLAQFHAASVCVLEKNGPFSNRIMSTMFHEVHTRKLISIFWANILNNLRSWNTCQKYVDRMVSCGL